MPSRVDSLLDKEVGVSRSLCYTVFCQFVFLLLFMLLLIYCPTYTVDGVTG